MIDRFRIRLLIFMLTAVGTAADPGTTRLWYTQPAEVWTEALPIGNGALGAMVFGGVTRERLQVNHDTLWTGQPHEYQRVGAVEVLPELRRLLREGRQEDAEKLAMERFMSVPLRQMMYQPFCDVWLEVPEAPAPIPDYERALDLDRGMATVSYRSGDTTHTRRVFSSNPDRVIVHRLEADRPGQVTFRVRVTSPHPAAETHAANGELQVTGRVGEEGTRFAARVRVLLENGAVRAEGDSLVVTGADAATLLIAAETSFVNYRDVSADPVARIDAVLAAVDGRSWEQLEAAHRQDYQRLFRRVQIDLGRTPAADLPTDVRLEAADKSTDPALAALLFNYGRYLLIASSRPGSQPANLQGIWNDQLQPPWGSKYTTNINLEMNYWPAEVAALPECAEPLFAMIEDLVESGRKTARAHYGADGWVLHHNTDLWRGTAPINHSNHGIWPTGGAWLCLHLWERYRFSGDRAFLAERAYPVMKAAAAFFIDTLVEDPETGWLISGPSNSPEHGGLVMGPTMDHQIIRSLFDWTAQAARILDVDAEFAAKLNAMRARIAPNRIGRYGQLQEWLEDVDDPQNRHRHVSHLWGVFPGEDISWRAPELMTAARRSLEFRGDGGTGWALGWKVALWARLRDGDRAHRVLMNQLKLVREKADGKSSGGGGTYPNLFDAHPPFQIDGNFAATAGVIEMLLQSHPEDGQGRAGKLVLLPALPRAWPDGRISGVRARGGVTVDLAWSEGRLTECTLRAGTAVTIWVKLGEREREVSLRPDVPVKLNADLHLTRSGNGWAVPRQEGPLRIAEIR